MSVPSRQPPVPAHNPALAQEGRQQVVGLAKKAKAPLGKMEKSRVLKTTEPPKAQDFADTPGRGPRIKHVCRRAAVALGRNRAIFPDDLPTLSALPWEERENILSSMGSDDKSSVAGSEEAEPPALPGRPVMRPRMVPDSPARTGRRSRRCGQCAGCQVPDDCGICANCLDKPKFGGRNIKKQCCKERKCQNLQWMPAKMFLQKPEKAKKDRKEKHLSERKDGHQPVKSPPFEGNPKPLPLTLKEEPSHGETPPSKHREEQDNLQPPSSSSPTVVPEDEQCIPPLQQPPPPQTQPPQQPNQTPPQKATVAGLSPSKPKERQSNANATPAETASEVKPMRKLTPGFPLPDKHKAKEKEKQSPPGRSLNSPSTPSTGGTAAPKTPGDGVRSLRGGHSEACDVEKVWAAGGLSIFTSAPIKPITLCLLCASSGNVQFVFCQVCCEPFHLFCLTETERPPQEQRENWCCRRCRFCQACGQQNHKSKQQLLDCVKCGYSYHPECVGPKHPRRPSKKNRVWICSRCVCCKSCGCTSPGKAADAQWSHDFSMCRDCAKLFVKGNFCPLCDKCYDDDDYESKMMQCSRCAHWVHARCENLTDERYEILSKLPESVVYTCASCTQRSPAEWRTALENEFQSSVHRVLTSLLNSRTAAHLLHCTTAVMKLPVRVNPLTPESEESWPLHRSADGPDLPLILEAIPSTKSPPDLESVKKKMEGGGYSSVLDFSDDIVKIIQTAINFDGGQPENKKANSMVKAFFCRQMERVFPWFQVKESRFWQRQKVSSSSELLPDAVLPPSLDHNYAQCQERDGTPTPEQSQLMKKIIPAPRPQNHGEPDPQTIAVPPQPQHLQEFAREDGAKVIPPSGLSDSRQCALCLKFGDDNANDGGRLLYIGQNEWAHVNCALWSVEVFEDDDGTLKNVHTAVARGTQMRCELCKRSGATVCCCVSGCSRKFHFMCAREQRCVFLEDKRVYCSSHHNLIKGEVVAESGFDVARRILVDFEGINLRKKFLSGVDPETVKIMIGSMTVDCLGTLTELSDFEHHLFPIGYQCSRVYWSTVDARRRCVYTFRILACGPLLAGSVSEMALSSQVDPLKSLCIPTTKLKAHMQNGEHNQALGQIPSSPALADSHHGIVKVDDATPSTGLHCSTSPSPYLLKQGVASTVHSGMSSQQGPFSPLPLRITPQDPGVRETKEKSDSSVETQGGETISLIMETWRNRHEGAVPKRDYSRRRHAGQVPGAEQVVASSTPKAPATLPPSSVVLPGLLRSGSCKLEKAEQHGRGTERLCLMTPHSTASQHRSNFGKDSSPCNSEQVTNRNSVKNDGIKNNEKDNSQRNSVKDAWRGNSVKDAVRRNLDKDTSCSYSETDFRRSNLGKDSDRNSKTISRHNSEKETRRGILVKDAGRRNPVKDASGSISDKETSRANAIQDVSRNLSEKESVRVDSVKDASRGNLVKHANRNIMEMDLSRANSEKDARRNIKDSHRDNKMKDYKRRDSKDANKSNSERDTTKKNSVKDPNRNISVKEKTKSPSLKDPGGNFPEKDITQGKAVKNASQNHSEKVAGRGDFVKNSNGSNLEKESSRCISLKDSSRSNLVKDAGRGNSVKDGRSKSVEHASRSSIVKGASCSSSVKDSIRSYSVNDTSRNSLKDTSKHNSIKEAKRNNSARGASQCGTVKGSSSCNSGKDQSKSVKDTGSSNLVKYTNRSFSLKDSSRIISVKDASQSTPVKENSMSKLVKDAGMNDLMKDFSLCNPVKDMSRSNVEKDTIRSHTGKVRNPNLAPAMESAKKPGPQPLQQKTTIKMCHGSLARQASKASSKPPWPLEASPLDAAWQDSEDPSQTVTNRISKTRERSSKVGAKSGVEVTMRDEPLNKEEVPQKGEVFRCSVEAAVGEPEKMRSASIRTKSSGTRGKEKHSDQAGSSSCEQGNHTTVEELKRRSEGLEPSQVDAPTLGKELSQRERRKLDLMKTAHQRTDTNELHTVSTSCSTVTSPSCSFAPAQGLHTRSSSLLVFSSASSSPGSSESESEHHLLADNSGDDKDAPEEGEENGSTTDENQDDSDESGSAKRRYPRRSARARSNMFFGLTPFYGVRSYGEEDMPFLSHGEGCEQKTAEGTSSKLCPEGQVDGSNNVSSSSEETEEDEEGQCQKKDTVYYNFTRTILNPGIKQSVGRMPEIHSFQKKELRAKETKREEAGGSSKSQLRISQLDGVDDGSESDASLNAAGMNTKSSTSTSKKSARKRKSRESQVEPDRPEKLDESGSSGSGNSGGRGNVGNRSRSKKNQKDRTLSPGCGKSQGQGPLEAQLSLSTDLLKSDSDNTNSDDCGNILPSDIMEFVLNTPSMQALDQQPESSSSQLLSLDEGFSLDGNRGKDMSLFEDFSQQLPSTESAERAASVSSDEPFLPLELPSDLSVLTTRSSSANNQTPQPNPSEASSHPIISLSTNDSLREKVNNKQPSGNIVSSENQQGESGDPPVVEGHITPSNIDSNLITSPSAGEVIELANRDVIGTSGTSGLQGLQKQKYLAVPAGSSGSAQVVGTAVHPTHLKPGTENVIVVNQHLQPLYVLQTCPGVTQKIQIAPSVTTASVIDTRSPPHQQYVRRIGSSCQPSL
ncbi:hypothetical protein GJAV_G00056510 [Gymnothorax javanicus]|nr:hypothetical protein GJAV_G00056510 [Gymnothorax javanicus]